jgi:ActR/RegA family two-component response regulator
MRQDALLDDLWVLILEDDYFFADDARRALDAAGARVQGPFREPVGALAAADARKPDCAVLDINIGPGPDFTLARALRARGVPFVIVTGYDADVIPNELADAPYLCKPTSKHAVVNAVVRLCGRRRPEA